MTTLQIPQESRGTRREARYKPGNESMLLRFEDEPALFSSLSVTPCPYSVLTTMASQTHPSGGKNQKPLGALALLIAPGGKRLRETLLGY